MSPDHPSAPSLTPADGMLAQFRRASFAWFRPTARGSKTVPHAKGCVIPNVKGKPLAAAKKAITKAQCAVGRVRKAASKKVRARKVISQSPAPGKHEKKGFKVNLVVSRGKH